MASEGRTLYCSPSGICQPDFTMPAKMLGMATSGGHASTATQRLRTSAAKSGTSCRQVSSAGRQSDPAGGQHLAPSSSICTPHSPTLLAGDAAPEQHHVHTRRQVSPVGGAAHLWTANDRHRARASCTECTGLVSLPSGQSW